MEEIPQTVSSALNLMCALVNDWATEKGWNETPDSVSFKAEQIALMHSELSECLEYVRIDVSNVKCECGWSYHFIPGSTTVAGDCAGCRKPIPNPSIDNHIPIPGEHAELADLAIRLFHYCGRRGINLGEAVRMKHAYNINRPYRHGKNI